MNRTTYKSLPSRGAWIEIKIKDGSPRTSSSRSPRGERGLKLRLILGRRKLVKSLPSRGAWIEIIIHYGHIRTLLMSLPSRGAWIEIQIHLDRRRKHARRSPRGERGLKFFDYIISQIRQLSLPSRGAWIEMICARLILTTQKRRSPRGERGLKLNMPLCSSELYHVAPLAGSVD